MAKREYRYVSEETIERAKMGDADAMEEIIALYDGYLVAMSKHHSYDCPRSTYFDEDAFQELRIKVWEVVHKKFKI